MSRKSDKWVIKVCFCWLINLQTVWSALVHLAQMITYFKLIFICVPCWYYIKFHISSISLLQFNVIFYISEHLDQNIWIQMDQAVVRLSCFSVKYEPNINQTAQLTVLKTDVLLKLGVKFTSTFFKTSGSWWVKGQTLWQDMLLLCESVGNHWPVI